MIILHVKKDDGLTKFALRGKDIHFIGSEMSRTTAVCSVQPVPKRRTIKLPNGEVAEITVVEQDVVTQEVMETIEEVVELANMDIDGNHGLMFCPRVAGLAAKNLDALQRKPEYNGPREQAKVFAVKEEA